MPPADRLVPPGTSICAEVYAIMRYTRIMTSEHKGYETPCPDSTVPRGTPIRYSKLSVERPYPGSVHFKPKKEAGHRGTTTVV